MTRRALFALALGVALTGVAFAAESIEEMADRHARLIMADSPEWATQMGVDSSVAGAGFSARLTRYDRDSIAATRELLRRLLHEWQSLDATNFDEQDLITHAVVGQAYAQASRHNAFGNGLPSLLGAAPPYAVQQLFGPQIDLPRLLSVQQPINNAAEVADWFARLEALPAVIEELGDKVTDDARKGVVPPHFALRAIADSADKLTEPEATAHPIYRRLDDRLNLIDGLSENQRQQFLSRAESLLDDAVYPAYRGFAARMRALLESAGDDAGLWRLEHGAEMYQLALDAWGADGLSAKEIHAIGRDEVERILSEMDALLCGQGLVTGDVASRMRILASNPEHLIDDTDAAKAALVEQLQASVDTVMEIAPDWFGHIPDYPIEVRRIPPFEQNSAPGGYYTPPPLDGSRPGIFWVNMKSAADIPVYTLKSLAFHEAVPGHHFQATAALSIEGLPLLRNLLWFGDYGEGWALYAEALAKEMGFYDDDPLGDLGRLRMELYRAVRLVVDTGLHDQRWTRERAIDYMVDITGETRDSITREVERYAVWPGQATSYKLGMLQFQRLRERAENELGETFDLRAFHDFVLGSGAMPMSVLAERVDGWIATGERP